MFSQARSHSVSVHATEWSYATHRNALLVGPTPSQLPVFCIGLSTPSKGHAPIERDQSEPSGASLAILLKDANGMPGFRPVSIASPIRLAAFFTTSESSAIVDSSLRDVKQDDSNNEVAASGGGEQIDDILDGLVGAVVGDFESAVRAILRVRTAVEAAVGKWSAQPFVEEQK
jgi:hypothetical protein